MCISKNDPLGTGMRCHLPSLPKMGAQCPVHLLKSWRNTRAVSWPGASGTDPFFCVTHRRVAHGVSADSMRKSLKSHFGRSNVSTHSCRKGGAHWWKIECGAPEELVQAQGGWCGPDTMRAIYARHTETERRQLMLACASRVDLSLSACAPSASVGALGAPPGPDSRPDAHQALSGPSPSSRWRRLLHSM